MRHPYYLRPTKPIGSTYRQTCNPPEKRISLPKVSPPETPLNSPHWLVSLLLAQPSSAQLSSAQLSSQYGVLSKDSYSSSNNSSRREQKHFPSLLQTFPFD